MQKKKSSMIKVRAASPSRLAKRKTLKKPVVRNRRKVMNPK